MKALCSAIAGLFILGLALPVYAARPTDEVKTSADRIVAILDDAGLKGDAHRSERRRLIREELDRRFDWPGIARSCLGRHWSKRSRDEQKEFIRLFVQFLEVTYLDKFETYYSDLDKIEYQGEKIIENYASVRSVITTKAKVDHPVEYRLQKAPANGVWQIYDVIIEGVSMVKNYREQFDDIIAKSSYEKLIADIKSKLDTAKPTAAAGQ
jgi:phospholipid transport system substrate-binding protein